MLEQLIAEYLIEAKRGVYRDAYVNIDVNAVSELYAEFFLEENENLIERFVDEMLLENY
tara:strand:- start:209 stop:385 length:177 start_codon:yes stop_codon:yes gene_type:complete